MGCQEWGSVSRVVWGARGGVSSVGWGVTGGVVCQGCTSITALHDLTYFPLFWFSLQQEPAPPKSTAVINARKMFSFMGMGMTQQVTRVLLHVLCVRGSGVEYEGVFEGRVCMLTVHAYVLR